MSRLILLMLPQPGDLDTIRGCLRAKFWVNNKIEGLGEAEELDAGSAPDDRIVKFEYAPGPSDELKKQMRARGLEPAEYRCYWARYGYGSDVPEQALLYAATALRGWLQDEWSRLLSPEEFDELQRGGA